MQLKMKCNIKYNYERINKVRRHRARIIFKYGNLRENRHATLIKKKWIMKNVGTLKRHTKQ